MEEATSDATVLVIEDERHLADLYARYLDEAYDVVTAYSGAEGLDRLSADVDVVVLDRQMPTPSGNEVLAAIEEREERYQVAMITAADPEFDVVGFGADDYLVKPVTQSELVTTVDRLLAITEYTEAFRKLTRRKLTRNLLRVEKSRAELERSERYRELEAEIDRLQDTVDALAEQLDLEEAQLDL